ncbi:MAG TPA: hypothetical protein VE398_11295 [Acidobacteriota bacterium]|nr:hypothetical protein [Acidobacteriota bacterium]
MPVTESVYLHPVTLACVLPWKHFHRFCEGVEMGILTAGSLGRRQGGNVTQAVEPENGLTLIETQMALLILCLGLLATSQMIYVALGSASLSRSKSVAALAAQSRLESLADLYRRNCLAADLSAGDHGPQQIQVLNPVNGTTLNRFKVSWTVSVVSDPRPGKVLSAKQVRVEVRPVDEAGTVNNRVSLNKAVSVTAIFSGAAE